MGEKILKRTFYFILALIFAVIFWYVLVPIYFYIPLWLMGG